MEVNKGTVVNVIENDYDMASAKIFLHENGLVHGGPKNIVAAGLRSLASYMPMPRPSTQPSAPSERPPGIKQLAAELGVSVGTVSRAMNNRYGVDPETRERVMEAAKRLGYVPDAAARRLKSHPLWRVTVLFAPFLGPNREINPAALATVEALRQCALRRGLSFALTEFAGDDDLTARCEASEFDVAITYGHFDASTMTLLAARGVPTVSLQGLVHSARQVPVRVDTHRAAYDAAAYLAALGHRRLALVAGPTTELHHRGFHEGFAEAVAEFALESPEHWRLSLRPDRINAVGATEALAPLLAGGRGAHDAACRDSTAHRRGVCLGLACVWRP
jgi:LacI family transcriptional regulator